MKKDSYYLRKFLGYALIYRGFSLAVFLMSFFAPFVRIAIPFLFSNFIDVITYGHDFKKAIYWATILLAVILLSSILGSIQQYFTEKYRQKLSIELRKSFMERFLKTELGYSTKMGSGYYLARMQEVVQLRNIMIDSFAGIVSSIILSIIGIISLLHINRWVGLVFLISIFPALWSAIFPQKKTQAKSLSLIHISEPTRLGMISYAVFCLKKKKKNIRNKKKKVQKYKKTKKEKKTQKDK